MELSSPFSAWESFYVIVGSAGAALTGPQFVVIALVTEQRKRRTVDQINTFATPTIAHFGAVLILSSILSVPWRALSSAAIALGLIGGAGVAYTALVMHRVSHQSGYVMVFEDWLFHTGLPFLSYAAILAASLILGYDRVDAESGLAAAALLCWSSAFTTRGTRSHTSRRTRRTLPSRAKRRLWLTSATLADPRSPLLLPTRSLHGLRALWQP